MNIYIYIISGPKKIESFVSVDGLLPVKFNVSNECRLQQSEERERHRRDFVPGGGGSTGLSQRNERSQREGEKKN